MHSPRIRCSAVRAFASDLRCLGVFCGWLTVARHDNRRIVWHPDDEQILRTTSSFAIHGRPYEFLLPSKCVQNGSLAVVASHQRGTKIVGFRLAYGAMLAYSAIRLKEHAMKGETRELWMTLCEQAAVEQDPLLLLELVTEINDLLEQKERRLTEKRLKQPPVGNEC